MMRYSLERRAAVLAKLMPPHNRTVQDLATEEGISTATLYNWRTQARRHGQLLPDQAGNPESWSSLDKFNAVLETAALCEAELGEYCRRRGLYAELNRTGNRGGGLVKVKQVAQPVLQVVDSNALRLRLAGCHRSIPIDAGG
ncbi:transposase [Alcaligenaceae bacterium CGII-47]|nr:transposase [Alcaligenaceae bacterium CGII-47]